MSNQTMLKIEDMHVHYGSIHALKGVSIDVKIGQIVTLIGANGAGKTTTLQAITNLVRKSGGKVFFCDTDITHMSTHQIVNSGIALVPEGRRIFPNLTVYENLMMGAY
ncbi:MAG TPA: ATP-binding cassette domain-containing protein, partial [Pseudothermotoga sp.]